MSFLMVKSVKSVKSACSLNPSLTFPHLQAAEAHEWRSPGSHCRHDQAETHPVGLDWSPVMSSGFWRGTINSGWITMKKQKSNNQWLYIYICTYYIYNIYIYWKEHTPIITKHQNTINKRGYQKTSKTIQKTSKTTIGLWRVHGSVPL